MAIEQKTGTAATIAIVASIASVILTFTTHPGWGLIVALMAVFSGVIGFVMAASPRVSGGILSIVSIVLGVFGLGLAILGIVGVILF
jgi:hypothetical protein